MEIALNVNKYLSACQLGITLASLALGWLGEPAFSALIRPLFVLFGLPEAVISVVAVAIVLILDYAACGDGRAHSQVVRDFSPPSAMRCSPHARSWRSIRSPIPLWCCSTASPMRCDCALRATILLTSMVYTDDEIKLLIDESTKAALSRPSKNEFVDNIFDIADKDAESLMTPRPDMVCLCMNDTLEENMRIVTGRSSRAFPVYRRDKRNDIVGFVSVKDLYNLSPENTMDDVRVRRIVTVPEGMPVVKLLKVLKRENEDGLGRRQARRNVGLGDDGRLFENRGRLR